MPWSFDSNESILKLNFYLSTMFCKKDREKEERIRRENKKRERREKVERKRREWEENFKRERENKKKKTNEKREGHGQRPLAILHGHLFSRSIVLW